MATKEHSSRTHPELPNKPGKTNWEEKRGGLPSYIDRVAKHIMYDSGYTESRAIAAAISQTKKRAATGNKEAIAAIAQWEKMKAGTKKVSLSTVVTPGRQRQFNEALHVRVGGRFASKGGGAQPVAKPQTARAQIASLDVGDAYNIPGIDGKIKRTAAGFEVTGPGGFKTVASTVTSAMAVAARLIKAKKGVKK